MSPCGAVAGACGGFPRQGAAVGEAPRSAGSGRLPRPDRPPRRAPPTGSILGFLPIPTSGSWDVKIAFYRTPLTVVGTVASVTLRLSKPLPAEESAWEVRVYKMQNSQARLVAKEPCAVDPSNTAVQTAPLTNTLRVEPGHNVALVNTAGACARWSLPMPLSRPGAGGGGPWARARRSDAAAPFDARGADSDDPRPRRPAQDLRAEA